MRTEADLPWWLVTDVFAKRAREPNTANSLPNAALAFAVASLFGRFVAIAARTTIRFFRR